MNKRILLIGAALIVTGCATSGPGAMMRGAFYGVQYSTVGEAEQVASNARRGALSEISPLPAPLIEKKLVIKIPSYASLSKYRDTVDPPAWNKAAQYARDFYDQQFLASATFTAQAIQKRGLYQSVEITESQIPAPEPVPTSNKDYFYWKFNPTTWGAQMYFNSEKIGQVTITGDGAAPSLGAATKSFLNNLSSLALTK